jgi:hypothetical protein
VTKIGELGTTQAATSNRRTLRRNTWYFIVTAVETSNLTNFHLFQVALFQLPDVSLMVSVYNKRSIKRKEMIGWFSLGLNSSGEEELSHWNDMRDVRGEQICRWHVLVES